MVVFRGAMTTPPAERPSPAAGAPDAAERRWILIRDLLVFAAKAAIEALRDVVLVPVSAVAGLIGLLTRADDPGGLFYRVLREGRRFDAWLNLFGALDPKEGERPTEPAGVDALVAHLETALRDEHRRGGVTVQAKAAIDRVLDRWHGGGRPGPPAGPRPSG